MRKILPLVAVAVGLGIVIWLLVMKSTTPNTPSPSGQFLNQMNVTASPSPVGTPTQEDIEACKVDLKQQAQSEIDDANVTIRNLDQECGS